MKKRSKWIGILWLLILPSLGSADNSMETPPSHSEKSCLYPSVGGAEFSGTQHQILFGTAPPFSVPQTYTFEEQYGELVRANISAPSLEISSFPVLCGYSPKAKRGENPLLICVEKDFDATRNVYVTRWTRDCVATELEVIGYEPGRFVGRINLTRVKK